APKTDNAGIYLDLGRAYEKNEEIDNAIANYEEAIKLDPGLATAHLKQGVLYSRKKDLEQAQRHFETAEELYRRNSNREGLAEVFFQRGKTYDSLNQLSEARTQLEKAYNLARSNFQRINTLLFLSSNSLFSGDKVKAQKEAEEVIDEARSNSMETLVTQGLIGLGNVWFLRGDYPEAEKYYKLAIDSANNYKGSYTIASARGNLGSLLVQQSRLDEGLREIQEAKVFFHSGKYTLEESRLLLVIARANRKQGDYALAQKAYEETLPLFVKLEDRGTEGLIHSEIGQLLVYQDRFPEALRHFTQRYRITQATDQKDGRASALAAIAEVQWQ